MWHLWASVLCFQLAACGVYSQALTVAAILTTPDPAPQQQPATAGQDKPADAKPPARTLSPGQNEDMAEIELPTGPMRIEPFSISEERIIFLGEAPKEHAQPSLRIQVKLTGERFADIVGIGHLVIDKIIDDTGADLSNPEGIQPRDLSATSPVRMTPRLLARGTIVRGATVKAPTRDARKIKSVTGWVNMVYGKETEDILIDNPLQYKGGLIKHPRLEELGMKIKVVEPGEEIQQKRDGRGIGLQFVRCAKQVRNTEFFDAWMKPIYPRARRVQDAEGNDYMYYGIVVGELDEDAQMLLTVFPNIEEQRLPFSAENLDLP